MTPTRPATTRSDDRFSVHQPRLIALLLALAGLTIKGSKMPRDFSGDFSCVKLPARRNGGDDTLTIPGEYRIKVRPTVEDRRKSSAHRTFVICPTCMKDIPTGRLHQHFHTTSKCRPNID
jgi:hypothetical protein